MDDKCFKQQQKRDGVTADAIAAILGRDRSVVSKILSGKQRMTLDWAKAFAEALQVPVATVLEKAGSGDLSLVRQLTPGFSEGDAVAWTPQMAANRSEAEQAQAIARALGAERPGIDVWRVKGRSMTLAGLLQGDYVLVDTHQSERVKPGDLVVAQAYNNAAGTAVTIIRRFEPPVLVSASSDPNDQRVHVVDGNNVAIRGKIIASWRV